MRQEIYSDIINRIRSGEDSAVTELVNKTMKLAIHIAGNLLYNRSDLEDILQDIYIKLWENLESYDEAKGKFTSWFARIVQNQCIDCNRKNRNHPDRDIPINIPDNTAAIDDRINRADFRNEILRLSDKLPTIQKEVFLMRDIQNMPVKEVQNLSGLSIGSIKTNLYLARKRIREMLDPEWNKD